MEVFVYILESIKSKKYYVGQTEDLEARVARHNKGRNLSTKYDVPWQLKWWKGFYTRSEAVIVEKRIKAIKKREGIEKFVKENSFLGV
jgi:putative endonuclease